MDDAPKTFRAQYNRAVPLEHIPTQLFQTFTGHTGGIQSLQWNPQFPLLFLSTSLDHSVRVWSMASPSGECRRTLLHHTQAVRRAQWSPDGRCMLSGGLDHRAVYADVETAQTVRVFSHDATAERVTAVTIPTSSPSLALLGLDSGRMLCCDLRAASTSVNKVYDKSLGYVHDLLCLSAPSSADTRFVSSTTIRQRNASHRTLLVWDLRTTALLFDRLDEEMYARPCLRLHPMKPWFLAQSSGDYASMFSATAPYKRRKRMAAFKHHKVGASSVQCSFSATGALVATGDLGGNVVVYDTETQQVVKRLRVQRSRLDACLSAEFHPMVHSMLLAAGQDRQIYLYH
ncbi:TPA: hypothetical protein N0F65_003086 [Lagenidium giganteum]|uniref:Uncharacterized protein n=1 Tax=Lagenidium giganteum TaxID=4803 RepID=A0AAV2YM16_9STRA|nr:TPA: hypothetical protein N0F65_003086 [Lagenidium giganteum]